MPPARKSCQRCRAHKARCIWSENALECIRCQRSNHPCIRPDVPSTKWTNGQSITEDPSPSKEDGLYIGDRCTAELADIIDDESGTLISLDATILPWVPPKTPFSIRNVNKVTHHKEQMPFVPDTCNKLSCILPPPDEGHVLLCEFLHDFNSRMPIFSPESLISLYKGCYSGENNDKPLAWVLVYGSLALTHRLRAMSLFAADTDTPQAEYYLTKSLSKLPELLMGPPSLRLVQALLCMAFLLQTSNKCNRAPLFASTAVHMAEDLGYNELLPAPYTDPSSLNEPYYVFWVAFHVDAHFSLFSKRPTTTLLANVSSPLPSESIVDWWKPQTQVNAEGWNVNIFAQHCALAMIEAEMSEELFSAKARRQPIETNARTYRNIMQKITSWRARSALSKLEAEDVLKALYRSDIVHCVMLEGTYFRAKYQCWATNALVQFTSKVDVFTPEALQTTFEMKDPFCYDDARRLLNLVALLPQGNLCTTWALIEAMVAAACTILCANSLRDAQTEYEMIPEVELCRHVLSALEAAAACGIDPALGAAIGQCRKVYQISTTP